MEENGKGHWPSDQHRVDKLGPTLRKQLRVEKQDGQNVNRSSG